MKTKARTHYEKDKDNIRSAKRRDSGEHLRNAVSPRPASTAENITTDAAGYVTYAGTELHNGIETAEFELLPGGYDFAVTDDSINVSLRDRYISDISPEETYGLYVGDEAVTLLPKTGDVVFKAELKLSEPADAGLIYALYDSESGYSTTKQIKSYKNRDASKR